MGKKREAKTTARKEEGWELRKQPFKNSMDYLTRAAKEHSPEPKRPNLTNYYKRT